MKHIFVANITIKAKTALKVSSGKKDFLQDSPIQKDWNNLPMILGTSLTGVLRKEFESKLANDLFGDENSDSKNSNASRVVVSNALLVDENNQVNETLLLEKSDFLKEFEILPRRDHNAINNKGVTIDKSKYDEEVVFSGSKFRFSISLLSEDEIKDEKLFKNILDEITKNSFRVGGGSTKGFGQVEVEKIVYNCFDLNSEKYLNFKNSLNTFDDLEEFEFANTTSNKYDEYILELEPDDFFMFGSGFGDSEADNTQVYEKVVNKSNDGFSKKKVLIPASSIKGAISHRTTYYYNKLNKYFIGNEKALKTQVEAIFGIKNDDKNNEGSKGKILISDVYLEKFDEKVFDHVAIDRFTGGAIEGALFQEKTIKADDRIKIEILLKKEIDETSIEAFESTLKDIKNGMLSFGAATTKGHGIFSGEVFKNGIKL